MAMKPLSEILDEVLMGLWVDAGSFGDDDASLDKKADALGIQTTRPRVAGGEEKRRELKLIWSNTAITKLTSERRTLRASLVMIAGGKRQSHDALAN